MTLTPGLRWTSSGCASDVAHTAPTAAQKMGEWVPWRWPPNARPIAAAASWVIGPRDRASLEPGVSMSHTSDPPAATIAADRALARVKRLAGERAGERLQREP